MMPKLKRKTALWIVSARERGEVAKRAVSGGMRWLGDATPIRMRLSDETQLRPGTDEVASWRDQSIAAGDRASRASPTASRAAFVMSMPCDSPASGFRMTASML